MHPDSIQLTWLVVLGAALQLAVMGQPWRSRDALPIFFSLIVAGACVALGRTERTPSSPEREIMTGAAGQATHIG